MLKKYKFSISLRLIDFASKNSLVAVCLLAVFLPVCVSAQTTKPIDLPANTMIRLKLDRKLSSGSVRIGDRIPFVVAEDVLHMEGEGANRRPVLNEKGEPIIAIKADTPVFGRVVDRKHRISIFRSGKFGVALDSVRAVDGTEIPVFIKRPGLEGEKKEKSECKDRISRKEGNRKNTTANKMVPCVKGRTYSGTLTSALPSAIVAALTTTALVLLEDKTAKSAAAVTLAGQVASQDGLSTILNGVDSEMEEGEIFEAYNTDPAVIRLALPEPSDQRRVARFDNPTPEGFVITNYFSDVVKYPNQPGRQAVYTGKVVERYTDKPVGTKMNICVGQDPPQGWRRIDQVFDPTICPREPSESSQSSTYNVIERVQ